MKKLTTLLFCAAALAWGGCSDNDEGGIDRSRLLGAWTFESVLEYDSGSEQWEPTSRTPDLTALDFRSDGTVEVVDCGEPTSYPYSLDGKRLTIRESDGYSFRFTIAQLTQTALQLHKKDVDDNYKIVYIRNVE